MGKVVSLHISPLRGTVKNDVSEVNMVPGWGLEGDGHGGDWDRQVSIFPLEALVKVPSEKREEVLSDGYTENVTISGVPLSLLGPGAVLKLGVAEVEICHVGKDEWKEHGRPYIVSREGRFGRVLKGGKVRVGDEAELLGRF
ncbi:Pyruvate kinase-like, insert domain protein [Acididesulfobacillus acetoxydans]|uniref:MOSC domain n=1 Tax=Acididesulfobacillus acetoxydans TaxID=1561005 RepID=A0A8S0W8C3_9FIRM|nr:MOSC domain-containing protein [Acididesulfobacillus acetoxydans]CAA7601729.1 Pyruvate kinase-like, insert domain protein [Acididesulfobacillus acetoxydans]CEJ09052.1 MOSC domain [Acididesulfobacillus acetoxydans]